VFVSTGNETSPFSVQYTVKLNTTGDTIWTRGYHLGSPNGGVIPGKIIELSDSTFVTCGTAYDSSEGASDSYLIKIAANGDSIWHRSIEGGFNDRAYDFVQTPPLLVGSTIHLVQALRSL